MDTVIVALPPVDDKVYRISSEKVPHLTILYLGEANLSADAVLYVEHACSELSPFYGTVEHRGTLGEDEADVLFFEDNGWDLKRVKEFRHWLLLNDEIKRAYDAAPQHEEWTPHLTLGYPETPAAEDDSDYPGIHSVRFDRVAVWLDDSEGPTFRLKYEDYAMDVAMSTAGRGEAAARELFHYGKKGMKWGVVNDEEGGAAPSGTRPVSLTKAEHKADPDGPDRRDQVKKAALIAGGVALAAGIGYGAYKLNQSGAGSTLGDAAAQAKKVLQPPTDIIHLARAKNAGLKFHSTGNTPDFFSIFDNFGLNGDVGSGFFSTGGDGSVAARFLDPLNRRDFAGRAISHDVVVPKSMAAGMSSAEDVREKIWPKIKDSYQKYWDDNEAVRHQDEEGVTMSDISTEDRGAEAASELFHYGKKGMKWGVRKDPGHEGEKVKTKKLDKLDEKWEKSIYSTSGAVKVHNAMADHFNKGIDAVNAKHPDADYRKGEDTPEWRAYMADVNTLQSQSYSHAVTTVHGSSPSGKKKAEYFNDGKGDERIVVHSAHLSHAEDEEVTEDDLILLAKTDEQGRILELNQAELKEGLEHADEGGRFFAHYGVKGMKWGVRNKDRAAERTPTDVTVTQKKPGTFAKTEGGKNQPLHDDATRALVARQKAKSSTTDALSNTELRAAVERMQLERKFAELEFANDRRSRGQRFVAGLFGKKKPVKYRDMDEEYGEKTRDAVEKALAARAAAKAARVATAAA